MNLKISLAKILSLLIFVFTAAPVWANTHTDAASDVCALPNYRTDVRPNAAGPATQVSLGMRLMDITEINDVNQTISVDLAMKLEWTDPRLANLAGCRVASEDIWFPVIALRNSGRLFQRWSTTVSIDEGGKAKSIQRLSGTFASYVTLRDFPFDNQKIDLEFFALEWSSAKLEIVNDTVFSGGSETFNISDWAVTDVTTTAAEQKIASMESSHSGFIMTISAKRYLSYYVWKILFPIAMIVIMSWSVFWIEPTEFGTKVGLSATSVLTMIAFIFATTNLLPKLGYFTTLDRYIAGATFFVFAALLQSLSTGFLVSNKRHSAAVTVDRSSRILFPAVFACFCGAILAHQI